MTVTLRDITLDECQTVREWRNSPDVLPMLRTGAKAEAEQAAFFVDVVSNPEANHRYYALLFAGEFVGMGGLTYLSRVKGEAEISLLLAPTVRCRGYGTAAVQALMLQAWRLHIHNLIGECYLSSPALKFWQKVVRRTGGEEYPSGVSEAVKGSESFWFRWRL